MTYLIMILMTYLIMILMTYLIHFNDLPYDFNDLPYDFNDLPYNDFNDLYVKFLLWASVIQLNYTLLNTGS